MCVRACRMCVVPLMCVEAIYQVKSDRHHDQFSIVYTHIHQFSIRMCLKSLNALKQRANSIATTDQKWQRQSNARRSNMLISAKILLKIIYTLIIKCGKKWWGSEVKKSDLFQYVNRSFYWFFFLSFNRHAHKYNEFIFLWNFWKIFDKWTDFRLITKHVFTPFPFRHSNRMASDNIQLLIEDNELRLHSARPMDESDKWTASRLPIWLTDVMIESLQSDKRLQRMTHTHTHTIYGSANGKRIEKLLNPVDIYSVALPFTHSSLFLIVYLLFTLIRLLVSLFSLLITWSEVYSIERRCFRWHEWFFFYSRRFRLHFCDCNLHTLYIDLSLCLSFGCVFPAGYYWIDNLSKYEHVDKVTNRKDKYKWVE